jgi:hypothetical protein
MVNNSTNIPTKQITSHLKSSNTKMLQGKRVNGILYLMLLLELWTSLFNHLIFNELFLVVIY